MDGINDNRHYSYTQAIRFLIISIFTVFVLSCSDGDPQVQLVTYAVTTEVVGGNGTLSPTQTSVDHGSSASFTIIPNDPDLYEVDIVTGCGGTLVGNTYTTNAITDTCTVDATFRYRSFTINAVAVGNGSISPSTQFISPITSATFTVTPDFGFVLESVTGCGGTYDDTTFNYSVLSGSTNCTVTATFVHPVPDLDTPLSLIIPDVNTATRFLYLGTHTITRINDTEPLREILVLSSADGDLTDQTLYDREQNEFNFDGLYEVTNGAESYYFRFSQQGFITYTQFSYVIWERDIKPPPGTYDFYVVNKGILQQGLKTFSTIGDSITWHSLGGHFRGLLDRVLPEYIYTGSRTDIFGYGHEGEGGNNTRQVINRLPYIENADIFFLLIGTNDRFEEIETVNNIISITYNLLSKSSSSIVYLSTLLPRTYEPTIDQRNIRINQEIRDFVSSEMSERVKLIELEHNFRDIEEWDNLLRDGLHPNLDGYKEIVRIISSEISM